jgi:hypothetical protein
MRKAMIARLVVLCLIVATAAGANAIIVMQLLFFPLKYIVARVSP